MAKTKNSLINRAKVSLLGHGIHENVVVTGFSSEERRRQGVVEKKMFYTY